LDQPIVDGLYRKATNVNPPGSMTPNLGLA